MRFLPAPWPSDREGDLAQVLRDRHDRTFMRYMSDRLPHAIVVPDDRKRIAAVIELKAATARWFSRRIGRTATPLFLTAIHDQRGSLSTCAVITGEQFRFFDHLA